MPPICVCLTAASEIVYTLSVIAPLAHETRETRGARLVRDGALVSEREREKNETKQNEANPDGAANNTERKTKLPGSIEGALPRDGRQLNWALVEPGIIKKTREIIINVMMKTAGIINEASRPSPAARFICFSIAIKKRGLPSNFFWRSGFSTETQLDETSENDC